MLAALVEELPQLRDERVVRVAADQESVMGVELFFECWEAGGGGDGGVVFVVDAGDA